MLTCPYRFRHAFRVPQAQLSRREGAALLQYISRLYGGTSHDRVPKLRFLRPDTAGQGKPQLLDASPGALRYKRRLNVKAPT
jgi:hypothetical protein